MRAPPEQVNSTSGRPSSVACSARRVMRSPTTEPIEPMKNVESITPIATRMPAMRPTPQRTPSRRPVFFRMPPILSR